MNFLRNKLLTPEFFVKENDSSLLAKNRLLSLIVYINNPNITIFVKFCIDSNITGN